MRGDLVLPFLVIEPEEFVNRIVINVEALHIEIVRARQPTDRRLECATIFLAPVDDPFEHAHVFTKTWPEEFSFCAFAEPIHVKNQRWIGELLSDIEPVLKIISDVIPAERQHRHWIAPHSSYCTGSRCGSLRSHCRAQIHPVTPIERLVNQRHGVTTASAENYCANRHAFTFLDFRVERRIVAHRRSEPAIRVRSLFL